RCAARAAALRPPGHAPRMATSSMTLFIEEIETDLFATTDPGRARSCPTQRASSTCICLATRQSRDLSSSRAVHGCVVAGKQNATFVAERRRDVQSRVTACRRTGTTPEYEVRWRVDEIRERVRAAPPVADPQPLVGSPRIRSSGELRALRSVQVAPVGALH